MTCSERGGRVNASEYLKDGLAFLGASGLPMWVDDGLRRTLGMKGETESPAEVLTRVQFQGGSSLQDVQTAIGNDGTWSGEAVGLTTEDHAVHLQVSGQRLDGEANGQVGCLLRFHNVFREQMMAHRISESQQMELVDKLSRGIAHEFKNLLTIIMAYGSLLELELQDSESEEEVGKIMQTAERANEVVRRLTSITRRPQPTAETTDLYTVMTEVNALLTKTLPSHLILKADEPRRMPMVHVDAGSLIRAVVHLALNASEAMPDGGELSIGSGVVDLTADHLEGICPIPAAGQYVEISVVDSGFGMTPAVQARLFEPFFTTKEDGSGLGLCFVREVIEGIGGGMRVRSDPGEGTTVTLYLPVLGGQDSEQT